jgi:hypothetical protein
MCSGAALPPRREPRGLRAEELMKQQTESLAAWIAAKIQIVGANFDPAVLQWPGGSLIATFLWLYAMVMVAWLGRHEVPVRALD